MEVFRNIAARGLFPARAAAAVAVCALLSASASSQFIGNGMGARPQPGKTAAVEFLYPEQVSVPAGKPARVLLHFRVAPGLHINSHRPHDEFLIPTVFSIPDGKSVRLVSVLYPDGMEYTLPADRKTRLNVYTGEFVLEATLVAASGNHLTEAKLRYQACDESQCMPPRTIPVAVDVIGK